jgi:hypothetical protein
MIRRKPKRPTPKYDVKNHSSKAYGDYAQNSRYDARDQKNNDVHGQMMGFQVKERSTAKEGH